MMNRTQMSLRYLSLLAVGLALIVIALGALTRLTDAGLGCPDWPGCYGHLTVPQAVDFAQWQTPLIRYKAWMEMVHRYLAGSLAVCVILVAFLCVLNAGKRGVSYLLCAFLLLAIVVYQALLGMWTVTLQLLPIVVSQHLLGGMTLLAVLWWVHLKSRAQPALNVLYPRYLRYWVAIGLVLVWLQIALGAWTSTNYAALSCTHFPFCHPNTSVSWDFAHAFQLFTPVGVNYEGGVLSAGARQTIQMMHRTGAVFLIIYWGGVSVLLLRQWFLTDKLRRCLIVSWVLLALQIMLGIANVVLSLPLAVAVSHTLSAALLLCTLVAMNFYLQARVSHEL